jgi:hypothetical protein
VDSDPVARVGRHQEFGPFEREPIQHGVIFLKEAQANHALNRAERIEHRVGIKSGLAIHGFNHEFKPFIYTQ